MTSIVKFTPLSGAKSEDPLCYLLQIDDYNILLDCGWNESLDARLLENLKRVAKQVDAVLLSYPDLYHLGALPYACSRYGLKAPIYATIPVYKMGLMFMYDLYQSKHEQSDFDMFTLDDVDNAFDKVTQLKYSQHFLLTGKAGNIEITPYAAGHIIGGTIWKIKKETEEILYAVDYNHKKERHLNPTVLETLNRPTLLITDAFSALSAETNMRNRDTEFFESLMNTLRRDGNVLIPTDSTGRALELLVCLEQYWQLYKHPYSVCMLNYVSTSSVEFAKSMLEWMSDAIVKKFDNNRENQFNFSFVKTITSIEELNSLPKPSVVVTSFPSLECGFARDLFIKWASDPKNLLLFPDKSYAGSLARRLLAPNRPKRIQFMYHHRVPLEGQELADFEAKKRKEKDAQLAKKRDEEEKTRKAKELSKMFDYEGEDIDSAKSLYNLWESYDLYTDLIEHNFKKKQRDLMKEKNQAIQDLPVPLPMFPYMEKRALYDDYGEVIRAEDYMMLNPYDEPAPVVRKRKPGIEVKEEPANVPPPPPPEEIPSKIIVKNIDLEINLEVKYIDFEGRSDGRSIKKIINHVNPRKLILIHGSPEATEHLYEYCEKNITAQTSSKQQTVFAPAINETADVTSDINIYKIRLKDHFLESLNFIKVNDYSIAYVDGVITLPSMSARVLNMTSGSQAENEFPERMEIDPVLDLLPPEQIREHPAIFLGDVKLNDFKTLLQQQGFRTEFRRGVLVVNGTVALRKEEKEGRSDIKIDGMLCEDYYKIRELLYNQFKIV